MAQQLMSPAIGAGEAFSLGSLGLVVFAAAIAGAIGGGAITLVEGGASLAVGEPGRRVCVGVSRCGSRSLFGR